MPDLYPYQVEGADFLAARTEAMLVFGMGLGKTATAITAAKRDEVLYASGQGDD
jgi:superfamily II DNA or RNA helicase